MRISFFLSVVSLSVWHTFASESNGTLGENIDGGGLIKLGRKLHKPMLTLIGMALQNLKTEEWTSWTPCDASRPGYFGSQTRTRSCLGNDGSNTKPEVDYRICEGQCPLSYNFTSNGFCLKLNTTTMNHDEAAKQCELEGGYLIHIDSQQKHDDVKVILNGFGNHVHIDGRRKDTSSPWEYKYGSQTTFLKWHIGFPNNGKDFCLALSINSKLLFDNLCTASYPFICEILIN